MLVDADEPDQFPSYCPVCGKGGIVMPSYPIGDACCPHCGSLIICKPISRPAVGPLGYKMLPDIPQNRTEAERVVAEQMMLWDEMKKRRHINRPSTLS